MNTNYKTESGVWVSFSLRSLINTFPSGSAVIWDACVLLPHVTLVTEMIFPLNTSPQQADAEQLLQQLKRF